MSDSSLLRGLADQFLISSESVNSTALASLMAAGPDDDGWRHLVQAEIDHVQGRQAAGVAIAQELSGHPDAAVRGRAQILLARFETNAGHTTEAGHIAATAMDTLPGDDTVGRAFAKLVTGRIALQVGDPAAATEALQEAQQGFETAGHVVGQSKVLRMLAAVALNHGHVRDVMTWLDRAEGLYRRAGWAPSATFAYYRGQAAYFAGQFVDAIRALDQGLVLADACGDNATATYMRYARGWASLRQGDLDDAERAFVQAMTWCQEAGQLDLLSGVQLAMAELALAHGDLPEAQRWCDVVREGFTVPEAHFARAGYRLTECRLWATADQRHRAWQALTSLMEDWGDRLRPSMRFEVLHLQRSLASDAGDEADVARANAAITTLGQVHGYAFLPETVPGARLPERPAPVVDMRCFETFTVHVAGESLMPDAWKGHRVKLLLATLLLEPEGITKEALTERLYPKQRPNRAIIAGLVKRLRRALDGDGLGDAASLILWRQGRYQINPEATVQCDLWAFERAWQLYQDAHDEASRATACRTLIDLYRGPLFVGFHDEPWILIAHQRTQRQWQQAYTWLQTWTLHHEGAAAALELADANLAQAPAAEAAHQFKIRTLLGLGDGQGARRQYETLTQCLSDAIGAAPNVESQALWAEIQAQ